MTPLLACTWLIGTTARQPAPVLPVRQDVDGHSVVGHRRRRSHSRDSRAGSRDRAAYTIVAMTADAMKGERERGVAAGMEGYSVSPIDHTALFAEVQLQQSRGAVDADAHRVPDAGPVDITSMRRRLSDDKLVGDVIELFLGAIRPRTATASRTGGRHGWPLPQDCSGRPLCGRRPHRHRPESRQGAGPVRVDPVDLWVMRQRHLDEI